MKYMLFLIRVYGYEHTRQILSHIIDQKTEYDIKAKFVGSTYIIAQIASSAIDFGMQAIKTKFKSWQDEKSNIFINELHIISIDINIIHNMSVQCF